MTKSFCDHCGKELDKSNYILWSYGYFGIFDGKRYYEFCPDCHEKIKHFIEDKEKKYE